MIAYLSAAFIFRVFAALQTRVFSLLASSQPGRSPRIRYACTPIRAVAVFIPQKHTAASCILSLSLVMVGAKRDSSGQPCMSLAGHELIMPGLVEVVQLT
jgi:hypothetical protein